MDDIQRDIQRVEQRVRRYWVEDGLAEILSGLMIALVGLLYLLSRASQGLPGRLRSRLASPFCRRHRPAIAPLDSCRQGPLCPPAHRAGHLRATADTPVADRAPRRRHRRPARAPREPGALHHHLVPRAAGAALRRPVLRRRPQDGRGEVPCSKACSPPSSAWSCRCSTSKRTSPAACSSGGSASSWRSEAPSPSAATCGGRRRRRKHDTGKHARCRRYRPAHSRAGAAGDPDDPLYRRER